jgi:hypothetical protein
MNRSAADPAQDHLLRAALPLLIVGVVAFVASFVISRDASHADFGHLPLWGLFAAIGAVVTGGGVTVLVAGKDPEESRPFYDPREFVLVPRARYDRLVAGGGETNPSPPTPTSRHTPAPWSEAEPTTPIPPTRPRAETPAPRRPVPSARTGFTPTPDFLPKVDEAIGEMEHLLEQLRQESDREARMLGRSERPSPGELPASSPPRAPPPERPVTRPRPTVQGRVAAVPATSLPARSGGATPPVAPARRSVGPTLTELEVCATCGHSISLASRAGRCAVCGGPMCPACLVRAKRAGHSGVCSRCSELLPTADREAEAPASRQKNR